MGLRNRSLIVDPTMFFVTFTTNAHENVFNNDERLHKARERLLNVCKYKKIKLFAYVIMSNHVHILVYCPNGGAELSKLVGSIKGLIRKDTIGDNRLWERGFDDKIIRSNTLLNNSIEYIHHNPVKAGKVENPVDYPFSSAGIWDERERDERVCTNLIDLTI